MEQTTITPTHHRPTAAHVRRLLERRSYAMLATVSPAGRPHAAGVLYELVGDAMFVNTLADSRKARNVDHCGRVGVTVPVRRVPAGGPPSAVQFQACAQLLPVDAPAVTKLVANGALRSLTSHGELELPGSCFVRIELPERMHTYGIGMSLLSLVRHPLEAGGVVEFS